MNFYNINIIFLFEKHIIVNCRFGAKIKSRNHTICMVLTVHSRYFEDINSMSRDTVTPNVICISKALLTKQTNGGVFLFLIPHFFPVIFILTSTIYK